MLRIDRPEKNESHPESVEMLFSTSLSADDEVKRFSLEGKKNVIIGRNAESGISLTDFIASREHAVLKKKGGSG